MEHTTIFSDGTGQAYKSETEIKDPNAESEEVPSAPDLYRNVELKKDPLAGLDTHQDPNSIPESFHDVFNKYLTYKHGDLIFRYKEVPQMEFLAHGIDPFMIEAYKALAEGNTDISEKIQEYDQANPEDLQIMLNEQRRIRNEILLYSLIDMTDKDGVTIKLDKTNLARMNDVLKEELYLVISKGGTAERDAVQRFLIDASAAYSDNDLPDGE